MVGASLPKRALSASATCPAGTIGAADGGGAGGVTSGCCTGGAINPVPERKVSSRAPRFGEMEPIEGEEVEGKSCTVRAVRDVQEIAKRGYLGSVVKELSANSERAWHGQRPHNLHH